MRKKRAVIREIPEDPVYKNRLVTKLINRSTLDGKKSVAQNHIYSAFEKIKEETKEDPLKAFLQAIENIKPNMEVRPRRIGGAAYLIPVPVRGPRKESLAIRWLVNAANSRPNSQYKTYTNKLAAEILDAYRGEGVAITKRKEIERIAEANRAFAHFRW
ncbi:MAG: 30S ribosomal protein S7 [Candidatus Blackburnbacteria bacterium]|nr:30S ribosomal protein S7 [Candidatus Blackburnbacteria bacterium]